jgi:hypothetical protein
LHDYGDAYGDLYQWGRAKDGHESIVGTATTIAIATNLNPVNNGAFILTNAQPNDWVAGVDNDGALRTVAWADGGVNDIWCCTEISIKPYSACLG